MFSDLVLTQPTRIKFKPETDPHTGGKFFYGLYLYCRPTPRPRYSIVILRHAKDNPISCAQFCGNAQDNWLAYQICISFDAIVDTTLYRHSSALFGRMWVCKLDARQCVSLFRQLYIQRFREHLAFYDRWARIKKYRAREGKREDVSFAKTSSKKQIRRCKCKSSNRNKSCMYAFYRINRHRYNIMIDRRKIVRCPYNNKMS